MAMVAIARVGLSLAVPVALAACVYPPPVSYYSVPCATPGAVATAPMPTAAGAAVGGVEANAPSNPPETANNCVLAVPSYAYSDYGDPYDYYGYGGYPYWGWDYG